MAARFWVGGDEGPLGPQTPAHDDPEYTDEGWEEQAAFADYFPSLGDSDDG